MTRLSRHLTAAALLLAAAGAAAEPDVDAVLARVEKRLYHPVDDGLKDLSAGIRSDMVRDVEEGTTPKIRFYWKAPDRRRVRFEGLDRLPSAARPYLALAEAQIRGFAFLAIREKFSAIRKDYDLHAEPDGEFTKITARRRPEAKAGDRADESVFWVDAQDRVVRVTSRSGATESEAAVTYIEKDGKFLQDTMTLRASGGTSEAPETRVSFEYAQAGKFRLVSRIRYTIGDRASAIVFEDFRINAGVDDSVFDEK